jgi:hypothetical protein
MGLVVSQDRTSGPWSDPAAAVTFVERSMGDDLSILLDRIHALLNHEDNGPASRADEIEHTLTDGYARALALEADRLRMEGRIHELAGSEQHVGELRSLKVRLGRTDDELSRLRDLLRILAATL